MGKISKLRDCRSCFVYHAFAFHKRQVMSMALDRKAGRHSYKSSSLMEECFGVRVPNPPRPIIDCVTAFQQSHSKLQAEQ